MMEVKGGKPEVPATAKAGDYEIRKIEGTKFFPGIYHR